MNSDQLKYLLALNTHPKFGSQTLKKLMAVFDCSPKKIWNASSSCINQKLDKKVADIILEIRGSVDPDKVIQSLEGANIGFITMYDNLFPRHLKEINDCPILLYVKGNVELLNSNCFAVVGSRKYSEYGKSCAKYFTKEMVDADLIVVSGLALGIDSIVHRESLHHGGKTAAVLGCGLDQIYPSSNQILAREILERGGLIVSEYPPGTPPYKQNFPLRNRIIAGLSLGVLVIEAREKSGALITAYAALEYNREVFAVPGDINRETSSGTNLLIKQGAVPALNSESIFEVLLLEKKKVEDRVKELLPLTKEEEVILNLLDENKDIDTITKKSGYNIVLINSTLTTLEMKGMIENIGGGRFQKVK